MMRHVFIGFFSWLLSAAAKLKQALLDLDKTPEGQEMLKKVGVPGFVEGNQQAYLDMLKWVEGK